MASEQQLRWYGHQALELAAEMEVDGFDPDVVKIMEAAGGALLIHAVKTARAGLVDRTAARAGMAQGVFAPDPTAPPFLQNSRPPNPVDTARRLHPARGLIVDGRTICCGHEYHDGANVEHFDFCTVGQAFDLTRNQGDMTT